MVADLRNGTLTDEPTAPDGTLPLLGVRDLTKTFSVQLGFGRTAHLSAVDGVSFKVAPGTTMGIVGESGCGKSTLDRLILGLIGGDSRVLNAHHPRGHRG